jgi:hypothetical protein
VAKKQEDTSPKVTNLPLPISDTPLVIDLPDGQKIVIGKMQAGSVIEVATWRGTGRPDSRTNRLMMGMNSGAAAPQEASAVPSTEAAKTAATAPQDLKGRAIFLAKNLIQSAQQVVSKVLASIKTRKPRIAKISSADTATSSSITTSSEVDEWLEKVLAKSERRAALAAQRISAPSEKKAPEKKTQAKKSAKKASSVKKKSAATKRKK